MLFFQDVLLNQQIKLDWFFKYSLIKDLVNVRETVVVEKAT